LLVTAAYLDNPGMPLIPPLMNAKSSENWERDRVLAKEEIIEWLAITTSTKNSRSLLENQITLLLDELARLNSVEKAIVKNPRILTSLRSLTRRDIGTSQIATFLGVGTSMYEAIERAEKPVAPILSGIVSLLEKELDESLAPWIVENRNPTKEEMNRSVIVAADRILKRSTSTELRYKHEPRQLDKLKEYLDSKGYSEVSGTGISNPRKDMKPGSYAFRVNIDGLTIDGVTLKQNVDTLIMPFSKSSGLLPIFLEAKSMTDEVNPNKRQKEEAQKVDNVRRKWQDKSERLNFVLLLGGTVPRRYLEVEAGSGLDWIWEHRVNDLDKLMDWYKSI
jgi:hypothetical protein